MKNRTENSFVDILTVEDGDKVTTVVVTGLDGRTGVGTARRDPIDRPIPGLGLKLATGRALRDLGRKLLHDANTEVRRQSQLREVERAAAKKRRKQAKKNRASLKDC